MVNIPVNNTPLPGSGTDQTPFYTGTQRPLLKHKDKRGSTEHHRAKGGGAVRTDQQVAEGLAEIAGNTSQEHRVEQINQFSEALESGDPSNTRALAENLAEIAGNTSGGHREEQIQQFQQHLAEEWKTENPRTRSPEVVEETAEEAQRDQAMLGAERERASQQKRENEGQEEESQRPKFGPSPGLLGERAARDEGVVFGGDRNPDSAADVNWPQSDRKTSRSQTTLSNMFNGLGYRAIGQQTPILEKHKDAKGSTEHHKKGTEGQGPGGSKDLFEGRPYGIGDLSGDQLAEITGDDRDKQPLGTDFYRTLPDGTEVAVTRQGDGQYHVAPTASADAESVSPSTTRGQRAEQRRTDMDQEDLQPLDPSAQAAVDELQERGMMPGGGEEEDHAPNEIYTGQGGYQQHQSEESQRPKFGPSPGLLGERAARDEGVSFRGQQNREET